MIAGKRIGLRALEQTDLPQTQEWRNREHYRRYFREYRELGMQNQQEWFTAAMVKDDRTLMFGIVELATGSLIGVCGLCYVNWVHRHADLSLYIGKDDVYIDPEPGGWAWDTLDVLLRYGFNELNLHKVWTEIYAFDEKKHALLKAYGFHQDAVLRDNYFYAGKYMDSHVFSVLDTEWRGARGDA
jgi:RimJ/RimL family protein N-acetyltransferase